MLKIKKNLKKSIIFKHFQVKIYFKKHSIPQSQTFS
jgi:hypothetical protein